MIYYDWWLQQGPGGPDDEGEPEDLEREQAREEFHALPTRARLKARRKQKRSTARRQNNPAWRRRQRRVDINAQELY